MTTPPPPPPRLRNILLGILVVVVLIVSLCSASVLVKWAGTAFLVLPRVFGVVESVRGHEIVILPLNSSPTAVVVGRPWGDQRRAWRRHQQERRRASETMLRRRTGRLD